MDLAETLHSQLSDMQASCSMLAERLGDDESVLAPARSLVNVFLEIGGGRRPGGGTEYYPLGPPVEHYALNQADESDEQVSVVSSSALESEWLQVPREPGG